MSKQSLSQSSPSSIYEKIEQAHNLLETCGSSLIEDPQIHALLSKLRDCIENTNYSWKPLCEISNPARIAAIF
jgi:mevalonate kinase